MSNKYFYLFIFYFYFFFSIYFIFLNFIFKLYIIVLVLPNIKMNGPTPSRVKKTSLNIAQGARKSGISDLFIL